VSGRHQEQAFAGEADDFGIDTLAVTIQHHAAVANGRLTAHGLQRQPHHARQLALDDHGRGLAQAARLAVQA